MERTRQTTDRQDDAHGPAQGAEPAIAWLEDHGDYLFSYAYARVSRIEVAEDLVQETLLAAIESHGRFEQRASVRTWLTSILRHKMIDHLRQQGPASRDTSNAPASEGFGDEEQLERLTDLQFSKGGKWRTNPAKWGRSLHRSADPADHLEFEEFHHALMKCMEKLPPRSAEAVDLVERAGMNLERISNILGVSTTNVGVILHRARLALRKCLEENWFRET